MKLNFTYLVLFLVFSITIFNLFFKQDLRKLFNPKYSVDILGTIPNPFNPYDKVFCSIYGFKCPDTNCICSNYCKGEYEKVNVYENEQFILFNEQLTPGTYCLPKGALECYSKSTIPIYSANNWVCVNKNSTVWKNNMMSACQNAFSENNQLNYLIDLKTGDKVGTDIKDFYEMYNGKLRYECFCGSKDKKGNKMITLDEVPFTCVSDYCLSNFKNANLNIGWDPIQKQCNCQQYAHENPNDLTSPCIDVKVGINSQHTFIGAVKCTHKTSFQEEVLHCSPSMANNFFTFTKTIMFDKKPIEYLREII